MSRELSQDEIDSIAAEIAAGRKIAAIKKYRASSGEGLKEAKDFIEGLAARLQEADPEKYAGAGRIAGHGAKGCGTTMVVLTAAVVFSFLLIR